MFTGFFWFTSLTAICFVLPVFWTIEFATAAAIDAAVTWISITRSREAAKGKKLKINGTCDEGFEWTVIMPISGLGATCCPTGYKGEYEIAKPLKLATVFCCPVDDEQIPCGQHGRELPSTPLDCPPDTMLVGNQCE